MVYKPLYGWRGGGVGVYVAGGNGEEMVLT